MTCTTHHNACECREYWLKHERHLKDAWLFHAHREIDEWIEKHDKLKQQNAELLELLREYHDDVSGIHDRVGLAWCTKSDLLSLRTYARKIEDEWNRKLAKVLGG